MPTYLRLFNSVDQILTVLENNKAAEGVQELLKIYHKAKDVDLKPKRYPLIVLEGLDGSGKTTTGNRFAKKINAIKWKTPPESITHLRDLFDRDNQLRTAYYSLGNYIAALEVQAKLHETPVLIDRFWHSTTAYALAQGVRDEPDKYSLPPPGYVVYKWPNDLFKPDVVLLLNVSEEVRKQRQKRRINVTAQEELLNNDQQFRQNVLQAYRNMHDPEVIFVDSDEGFNVVLKKLHDHCRHLL